jgi:very-short-patch-repair endonuclease
MKPVDVALARQAASQHGVVHRRQALALGMTERQLERRLEAGLLVSLHRAVYRHAGHPASPEQLLLAACLTTGAVASHRSAAALWGLRGCDLGVPEVTLVGRCRPTLAGVAIHRTDRLDPVDISRRHAIPVTAPARTLLDLAGVVGIDELEPALEDAMLRGLAPFSLLRHTVDRLGGRGRRGAASLRAVLDSRDPATAPTESVLEDALVRVLRRGGLPEPVRQLPVGAVRVDLAYPGVGLAIEADSRVWHVGRQDVQRNAAKQNVLVARGWRVLRFTWFDVTRRPAHVVGTVRSQLPT